MPLMQKQIHSELSLTRWQFVISIDSGSCPDVSRL